MLGLRREDDVIVIDDSCCIHQQYRGRKSVLIRWCRNFPDSMTATWDPRLLSNLLLSTFAPKLATTPSTSAPPATIDVLITFDEGGVSGHPNHISLLHGARAFMKALMHRHSGWNCPVTLYTLTSTNIVRKYLGLFDAPITLLSSMRSTSRKSMPSDPARLFFANGLTGYWAARQAMTAAHKSQMLWFRWFWIVLSRYMTLNDLKVDTVRAP